MQRILMNIPVYQLNKECLDLTSVNVCMSVFDASANKILFNLSHENQMNFSFIIAPNFRSMKA